jgi:hypothetical protein
MCVNGSDQIPRTKERLAVRCDVQSNDVLQLARNAGPIPLRRTLDPYSYDMDAVRTRITLNLFDSSLTRGGDVALGRSVELGRHSYAKLLMRVDFRWPHPPQAATRGLYLCAGVQSAARLRARILGKRRHAFRICSLLIRRRP